ncbi:S1 RNA-binding domain-containing protein [Streptomyces anulatus]|uniref:S1 RNA-binding domain-containing protein n=1 Tax=Streptomyces anulatus TaxID=1892 RepID=UPI00403DDEFF
MPHSTSTSTRSTEPRAGSLGLARVPDGLTGISQGRVQPLRPMPEDERVLPYVYRVTKYDPADRDEHGHYIGPEDTVSDHGPVEAAYLQAVEAFAVNAGIDHLAVREPQVSSLVHFGVEETLEGFGLEGVFPAGPSGFHDGAVVPLDSSLALVRIMLRDGGAWCRLEAEDAFAVHVGWDQYLYIGSSQPCEDALVRTRALGLFPERADASPYDVEADGDDIQRPGDDEFWAGMHWAVAGRAGILEETYVEGASRWHHLTRDTVDTVRAGLAPRARLAVWPDLSSDIDAVLGALPTEGLVECVWQDEACLLHSAIVDEDEFAELTARISGARAAALLPVYADERVPLFTAVMPDSDGEVRARWQTESTPGDRNWAFLKTLRQGQIVTGPVTLIASFGVTFVDIGGFEAKIHIPELSWRPFNHPSDVVAVGQEISAEILGVDPIRKRVQLSMKALQEDPMRLLTGQIGQTTVGRVTKLVPFGVFVRIEGMESGFEGLVHNSELGEMHLHHPQQVVQAGDALAVKILDVDPDQRRITLSHRQAISVRRDEQGT